MLKQRKVDAQKERLELGDLVTITMGDQQTLRSYVEFDEPVNGVRSFYLLGNFKVMLVDNDSNDNELDVYLPVGSITNATGARVLLEGKTAFWSAHLPAVTEAMGIIYYRVLEVSSALEPYIVLYRGPEILIFIKTHGIPKNYIKTQTLPRRTEPDNISITRHAVTVEPLKTSAPVKTRELVDLK